MLAREIRGAQVGRLYDYSARIQSHIEQKGLDVFRTRGELALHCGFLITLIEPNDPDDAQKIEALRTAAREVLGLELT